jgi:2-polyprenyl-3-methyl-5-hydroxy-6-metoxy-1,4-benzoquinol methylase
VLDRFRQRGVDDLRRPIGNVEGEAHPTLCLIAGVSHAMKHVALTMVASNANPGMTRAEVEREVSALPLWHYQFDLQRVQTPIRELSWVNRHRQRKKYFFDPLSRAGAFRGKRVLDLGCNAGFWALSAIEAGAAYVLGIDARAQHVAQANLVFRAKNVSTTCYDFVEKSVFDPGSFSGAFDVVLLLGLLYHVCKPIELLQRVSAVNDDLLVIDTGIIRHQGNLIELREDPLDDPRMSTDSSLVFWPSHDAVITMVKAAGYPSVLALTAEFDDWTGCDDFRVGDRRAFVCTKRMAAHEFFPSDRSTNAA